MGVKSQRQELEMVTASAETQRDVCGANVLSLFIWDHSPYACYHPHLGWIVPSRLTQPRDSPLAKPTGLCLVVPSSVEMTVEVNHHTHKDIFKSSYFWFPGLRGRIILLLGFVWGFSCSYSRLTGLRVHLCRPPPPVIKL